MPTSKDASTLAAVNQNTPSAIVYNNQGLTVRSLMHYRKEAEKTTQLRISLQRYDTVGYLKHCVDARLSEQYLQNPKSAIPNQSQVNTLSGTVLQSKNVDAGMRIGIPDVHKLMVWTSNGLGTERTFDYDTLGHVTSVSEKTQGKKAVCCERFVYGDKTAKEVNGIGRLLKHYDSAGLREIKNYSALGTILAENQQFLEKTEIIDWPEDLAKREQCLEQEHYTTQWEYNALGETLSQTDAKGNKHSTQYGVAGELLASSLQLKGEAEQRVVDKQVYSAVGQLLEKRLSNGVVINYHYEEKTQRLSRLHSLRLSDNQSLQDLNYRYDPIGNILEIFDKSKEPGFYANEKTEAVSQYRYDSLYQLIEANGIESQQAAKESAMRNPALQLGNPDASRCVNYTRTYEYDTGGNLYEIQHRGVQSYTQSLEIEAQSNRGIEKRDNGPNLVESFDANGNLLYLNIAQPLQWDSRNQLQQIVQLKRETYSDKEQYRYDANSQRVEKLTQRLAQEQIHNNRFRYLPGLELREHWQTDTREQNKKTTEQLQVIQSDGARVLHWATGKPNEIENDGLRYTLTDQLGSSQLELNAKGETISYESYYPYGGTAIWATKNIIETHYKFLHYSGKEQDATGLYYYGYRYYVPWLGRWLNADPTGTSDGLNLYRMARNNPITFMDTDGAMPIVGSSKFPFFKIKADTPRLHFERNDRRFFYYEGEGVIPMQPYLEEFEREVGLPEEHGGRAEYEPFRSRYYRSIDNSPLDLNISSIVHTEAYFALSVPVQGFLEIAMYTIYPNFYFSEYSQQTIALEKALARLRPWSGGADEDRFVHRASGAEAGAYFTTLPDNTIGPGRIQIGDIVTNDRFLSTSLSSSFSFQFFNRWIRFGRLEASEARIYFEIKSISGRDIDLVTPYPAQIEVLHLKNRNFRVVAMQAIIVEEPAWEQLADMYKVTLHEVEGPFPSSPKNMYTGIGETFI
jgi:insecticidal toxin complex protein TccC